MTRRPSGGSCQRVGYPVDTGRSRIRADGGMGKPALMARVAQLPRLESRERRVRALATLWKSQGLHVRSRELIEALEDE